MNKNERLIQMESVKNRERQQLTSHHPWSSLCPQHADSIALLYHIRESRSDISQPRGSCVSSSRVMVVYKHHQVDVLLLFSEAERLLDALLKGQRMWIHPEAIGYEVSFNAAQRKRNAQRTV